MDANFVPLFDGKSLSGWRLVAKRATGMAFKDVCESFAPAGGGGGNLLSEKESADFILRLEFPNWNPARINGIAFAPRWKATRLPGMEIQSSTMTRRNTRICVRHNIAVNLRRCSGAARRLEKAGEWNEERSRASGARQGKA